MQIVDHQRRIEAAAGEWMPARLFQIDRPVGGQVPQRGKSGLHQGAQRRQLPGIAISKGHRNVCGQDGEAVTAVAAGHVDDATLDGQGLD